MKIRPNDFIKFDRQFPIYNFFFPSQGGECADVSLIDVYDGEHSGIVESRALYFHIPFCETICSFCPFTRGKYENAQQIESYVCALIKEIEEKPKRVNMKGVPVGAIFFGGGTPSLLTSEHIMRIGEAISRNFDLSNIREYSFEIEVKSLTDDKVKAMRSIGVTHPRFGLQTFSAKWRDAFELTASIDQIYEAASRLNNAFPRVSFDILYGMNGQDEEEIAFDLECAIGLGTTNIDIYPIDNVMTQVGLHRVIDASKCTRTSATRKFAMNVFVDQMMRHSGFMPHNGHGYVRENVSDLVVSEQYSFVYHESVYGYQTHDLMGFGTNAVSSTPEFTLTNVRSRDKYVSEMFKSKWSPPYSASRHDVVLDYCRPLILRLPYHGELQLDKVNWDIIPEGLSRKVDELVEANLAVRDDRSIKLTKLGWYWYVNMMY